MIKRQLNPLRIGKGLLCLLALFMMLLTPQGAWAEDYALTVGGVQVTSDNAANVLSDTGTPTVVFDAENNILTLNKLMAYPENETAEPYISNGINNLTINLAGTSRIQGNNSYLLVKSGDGADNTVTFTTDPTNPGSLEFYGSNYSPWYTGHTVNWSNGLGWKMGDDSDYGSYVDVSSTGLTIAGTPISNGSNTIGTNTVSFNSQTSTLTLNEVNFGGSINWTASSDLTVELLGDNTIDAGHSVVFVGNENANLTFTTNSTSPGKLNLTSIYTYEILSGWNNNSNVVYIEGDNAAGFDWWADGYSEEWNILFNKKYNLWVDNVQLCDAQNEVSFDPQNYSGNRIIYEDGILKFNTVAKNTENSPFIKNGLSNLTIKLFGNNTVGCGQLFLTNNGGQTNNNITFTTDKTTSGTLVITTTGDEDDDWYTGHNAPTVTDLAFTDEMKNSVRTLTFSEPTSYNLTVANIPVTSGNASGITGDYITGTVTYDADKNTLTLNNATIMPTEEAPGIVFTSEENLVIEIIGTNVVKGAGGCEAIRGPESTANYSLTITRGDENDCSLRLESQNGTVVSGFSPYGAAQGIYSYSEETSDPQSFAEIYTTKILSGGSGTESDPFIIKTAEDLKNMSVYLKRAVISPNSSIKIDDNTSNIDCTNLEGFEIIGQGDFPFMGTFDGNNKTISNLHVESQSSGEVGMFKRLSYINNESVSASATVKNLTLSGCSFSGGTYAGAIAGYMEGTSKIENCKVINCHVNSDQYAGGIVGHCYAGTVTGNSVEGETTVISNQYSGAIAGKKDAGAFNNNKYYYTVKAQKIVVDADPVVKENYEQRGLGEGIVVSDKTYYDIAENDGAVMYTKTMTTATVANATLASWYSTVNSYTDNGKFAPGVEDEAYVSLTPSTGYAPSSLTVTYTEDETEKTIIPELDEERTGDGIYIYKFTMPDADVVVNATVIFDISNTNYTASIANVIYTGEALMPTTVTLTPKEGTQGLQTVEMINTETTSDFEITKYQKVVNGELVDAESPIDADTYTVTINGVGNYTGTTTASYTIEKAHIQEAQFTKPAANNNLVYNGEAQQLVTAGSVPQGATVKYYSRPLSEEEFENEGFIMICEPNDEDYTDNVPTSTNVGYFGIVYMVDGGNNYVDIEATQTLKVAIDPAEITSVTLNKTEMEYNSSEQTVTISSVKAGTDSNLDVPSTDYTVALDGNAVTDGIKAKNTGTYTVTVTAKDKCNFTGSADATFTISDRTLVVSDVTFHNGWTTYYSADGNVLLPANSNVGAFVASGVGENSVTVTQISNIPEKVAVLLNNATTTTTTNVFGTDVKGNLLQHAATDVVVDAEEGDFYGLYNGAFMRITDKSTIPAGKNYLLISNAVNVNTGAPKLNIVFDNEANMTGIDEVRNKMEDVRGDVYDLMGRKVQKPSKKGLYISKGHKVVVNK